MHQRTHQRTRQWTVKRLSADVQHQRQRQRHVNVNVTSTSTNVNQASTDASIDASTDASMDSLLTVDGRATSRQRQRHVNQCESGVKATLCNPMSIEMLLSATISIIRFTDLARAQV